MDPLSICASVTALATATFQVVRFLGEMKEGGNDRLRLTTEINSLWMILKLLEEQLEPTNSQEKLWLQGVRSLQLPNGVFHQISEAVQKLNGKLKPQTGHRKTLQTLRWPLIDKKETDEIVNHIGRLKSSVSLVLNYASLAVGSKIHDSVASQKVIWCPGIPGAGKTFLASIVIEKLRELNRGRNVAIFMLYCSYNDLETQSVQALIASLIKQDVQGRSVIDGKLGDLHETHYEKGTRPTLDELKDVLGNAISHYEKTFIVLDAVDEMLDEKCRSDLVDCLRGLDQKPNLLVTSRPIPAIKQMFNPLSDDIYCDGCLTNKFTAYWHCTSCGGTGYVVCQDCHEKSISCPKPGHILKKHCSSLTLDIQATDQDLQTYITQRIAGAPSLGQCVSKKAGLKDEILEQVTQFANGMFLLAKFHMDSLSTKLRPSSVLSALKNLPTEIDSTYDQAMGRIQSMPTDHREIAECFLAWIAYTDRVLTIPEIEHATVTYMMLEDGNETRTIDTDDIISASDLSSMCAGLVTIDGERMWLVHYTAVTYLDKTREKWFPNAYTKLTKTCLTYLMLEAFDVGACTGEMEGVEFEQRNCEFPLLGYASLWWGRFAYHVEDVELREMVEDFLYSNAHIDASVQALWYTGTRDALTWNAKTGATALHLAAYFGLERTVADLLEGTPDIDARDSLGNTAMMYAASEGYHGVVTKLLEGGASVNMNCHNGSNVLHRAALEGRSDVVEVLLGRSELRVNVADRSQRSRNALMLAAIYGHGEVVKHLLKRHDLCPNLRADQNALMLAAMNNKLEIVMLLLKDPRVSINDQDRSGFTALMLAAYFGYTSVVAALLDAGADAEITAETEEASRTLLLRAIASGHLPVVRLLLQRNVDWRSKDKYDRTLLHDAATNGRSAILQLLLEQTDELDVNAQDKNGRVPLHDSAQCGYVECIKILLKFGACTDIKDIWGQSPLRVAKDTGHPEAFEIILKAREAEIGPFKRVDTSFSDDRMPLWVAAKQGRDSLVESAIESAKTDSSIDLEAVDPAKDRTALHYASSGGYTSIVKSLLDAGVDINRQDRYGQSPITLAAVHGHVATARALLAHRANVNLTDQLNMSPLYSAEIGGHYKIAVLLIQNGAALSPNDTYTHDTLCIAAAYGYSEVVLKLIMAGAEPQQKDKFGMTPFQTAKRAGHEKTAQILLEYTREGRSRLPSLVDERRFSIPSLSDESEEEDDFSEEEADFSEEEESEGDDE